MTIVVLVYYIAVNIILWGMMKFDKEQARRHGRRIPERRLLSIGLIGGAFGGIAAMRAYRHKTKYATFALGFPVMALLHALLICSLFGADWLGMLGK
ncbi:DUF1294 domain-containing protein [Paenibacillus xylaniclasticus]|uniref:DUF1294 domain-containing protein n=1 Tax=Paenibacillus xylaniclasticus TaxID=588083 RepID=UPI000FDC4862|nr:MULTISPECIES: DUF1294 domain-containing protein [Paenibacillus]GFN31784.1 hypothetical protein PCURB6_20440 [Paenibacillus curdlanolyticus]